MKAQTEIPTQGLSLNKETMYFDPGPVHCGNIDDGVEFACDDIGAWVISFDSLRLMYEMAVKVRESND